MNRGELLRAALHAVDERGERYGAPADAMTRIAKIWSVVLDRQVEPVEVALCLAGMKLARLAERPDHDDSWVDLAGYASVGAETIAAHAPAAATPSDLVSVAMHRAAARHAGGSEANDGRFNLSDVQAELGAVLGMRACAPAEAAYQLLVCRNDVERMTGGAHFRMVRRHVAETVEARP